MVPLHLNDTNGEAIYATRATPLEDVSWARMTYKEDGDHGILYVSVFDWPEDSKLKLQGLRSDIRSVSLLKNGETLTFKRIGEEYVLSLPSQMTNTLATVPKVQLEGKIPMDRLPERE